MYQNDYHKDFLRRNEQYQMKKKISTKEIESRYGA
jgi:hypothetical protein